MENTKNTQDARDRLFGFIDALTSSLDAYDDSEPLSECPSEKSEKYQAGWQDGSKAAKCMIQKMQETDNHG